MQVQLWSLETVTKDTTAMRSLDTRGQLEMTKDVLKPKSASKDLLTPLIVQEVLSSLTNYKVTVCSVLLGTTAKRQQVE